MVRFIAFGYGRQRVGMFRNLLHAMRCNLLARPSSSALALALIFNFLSVLSAA